MTRFVVPALALSACLLSPVATPSAHAQLSVSQKDEPYRLLPDRDDPGFESQLRRAIAGLSDADPRWREGATSVLSHSQSISCADLLRYVTPETSLETRWRLLEAARVRFERSERAALGVHFGSFDGLTAINNTVAGFDGHDRAVLLPGDTIVSIDGISTLTPPPGAPERATSVVAVIQPAIIAHDPGDVVELVVSRVSDPELRPSTADVADLRAGLLSRTPDQSDLPRELVTIEVQLGSFGGLNTVGSRGPNRAALEQAWEYRLRRDGIGLGLGTLEAPAAPLQGVAELVLPPANVADAFSEFRSIFLSAPELPEGLLPEMLPDRRDIGDERRRALGGRATLHLAQQRALEIAALAREDRMGAEIGEALPATLPGGLPGTAAAVAATGTSDAADPRAAALILDAARMQSRISNLAATLRSLSVEDPSRSLVEDELLETRERLAAARLELSVLPASSGLPDGSGGVEISGEPAATGESDS